MLSFIQLLNHESFGLLYCKFWVKAVRNQSLLVWAKIPASLSKVLFSLLRTLNHWISPTEKIVVSPDLLVFNFAVLKYIMEENIIYLCQASFLETGRWPRLDCNRCGCLFSRTFAVLTTEFRAALRRIFLNLLLVSHSSNALI